MQERVQEQLQLEQTTREQAYLRGTLVVASAMKEGRYCDLPQGRLVLARAFNVAQEHLVQELESTSTGLYGKYKSMLRRVPVDVLVVIALRTVLNACADPEGQGKLQSVLGTIGRAIELESMCSSISKSGETGQTYLQRTIEYLDAGKTTSLNHRYRTLLVAAEKVLSKWEPWSAAERESCAKVVLKSLWETGLFQWKQEHGSKRGELYIQPSLELAQHFSDIQDEARPIVEFKPMLVPPAPWENFGCGGYMTPWLRAHAPMMSLHGIPKADREWVMQNLKQADIAKQAMNRAQEVPYRVNEKVLVVFLRALGNPRRSMGLPPHGEAERPQFPLDQSWDKARATEGELETFQFWKQQVAAWHADVIKQRSKKRALAKAAQYLQEYKDKGRMWFVSYLDYRGRLYFRGSLHPQGADAVKGCLEFADGEPLGDEGLFWLKVHVANCAGFDKKDMHLRAAWTDEHWDELQAWASDPIATDAPDPDCSFCLLAAVYALQEALSAPDPRQYICHLPVAQDATCSGLQHFSAMFRDPVGAQYTNLTDPGGDQKQDIYMQVAGIAQSKLHTDDPLCAAFWHRSPITRAMAKRPVMTYVYGSTLKSNMDYVSLGLAEDGVQPIRNDEGKIICSLNRLSVPVAKALRVGVMETVPAATAGMEWLQAIAKGALGAPRWITPAGVPVVSWAEGKEMVRVRIQSMGVTNILMQRGDRKYNPSQSIKRISPNFVHSMDSAHLSLLLSSFPHHVMPIHDSFAVLPNRVSELRDALRGTFYAMYCSDVTAALLDTPMADPEAEFPVRPKNGTWALESVLESRFCFC